MRLVGLSTIKNNHFIASFNWVQVSTSRNGYSSLCHLPMEKPSFLRTIAMAIYHSLPTAQCLSVLPIPGASVHEIDLMGTGDLHLREERRKPNIYIAFSRPGSLSMESLSKQSCLSRPLGLERRPLVTWHAYMLLTCRVKTSKQQCMPRLTPSPEDGLASFKLHSFSESLWPALWISSQNIQHPSHNTQRASAFDNQGLWLITESQLTWFRSRPRVLITRAESVSRPFLKTRHD